MDERLAAADAALKAGRRAEAIDLLIAAITDDPAQPVGAYRALLLQLYRAGRPEEGETWGALAVQRHPRDSDLWNMRGVMLRQLKRLPEAIPVLEQAVKLAPASASQQNNLGNVLMDSKLYARAEAVFTKLARKDPRNSEYNRQIGRALRGQGKHDAAVPRFRQAVALDKTNADAWLDLISVANDDNRTVEAEELCNRGIAANPGNEALMECKITVIRRSGQFRRAEAALLEMLPEHDGLAWVHFQLGSIISDYDRDRGNVHMRKAVALNPNKINYRMALIESLERTRTGDEGANIEESYQLALQSLELGLENFGPSHLKVVFEVLLRVCDFDGMVKIGTFRDLGRGWAETGRHTALLKILGHVRSEDDRYEMLELHRIWGRAAEAAAARSPVRPPPPRACGGKIRLGFMSSDLRRHPVGYFSLPLFEQLDKERFEVYCYSFSQHPSDPVQDFITNQVTAYRWNPDISTLEAAQMIADDQLDMLIELGGSTHMNKLEVMAYRLAPCQASWLGYPHSAGLSTIDYLMCDPYLAPPDRGLMVEAPMMMPKSWIALGRMVFSEAYLIEAGAPFERHGAITFGTANNPYKYSRDMFKVWAQVLLQTPGSRFLLIRPEGGTPTFRKNVAAEFAACGVEPDRIEFATVRGRHMPFYNQVDVALDTFPQTGGTTTCEAAWMGVPTVSLVGHALFERLSYSILVNAGLADLCADTVEDYIAIAVRLAADRARIKNLRHSLRGALQAGPLGQTEQFAKDFYDLVARTVQDAAVTASARPDSPR